MLLALWETGRCVALVEPALRDQTIQPMLAELASLGLVELDADSSKCSSSVSISLRGVHSESTTIPESRKHFGWRPRSCDFRNERCTEARVLEHGALPVALDWYVEQFGLSEADRYVLSSPLAHDPVFRDILAPLSTGARLVLPDERTLESPIEFRRSSQQGHYGAP